MKDNNQNLLNFDDNEVDLNAENDDDQDILSFKNIDNRSFDQPSDNQIDDISILHNQPDQDQSQNNVLLQQKAIKLNQIIKEDIDVRANAKICCVQIRQDWSIRRQMLSSLIVLSLASLIIMGVIIIGNIFLTRYLITKSTEDAVSAELELQQINFNQNLKQTIQNEFGQLSALLLVLKRIVMGSLKLDDSMYDFSKIKDYPVVGPKEYFAATSTIPSNLIESNKTLTQNYKDPVTFKTFSYAVFSQQLKSQQTTKSQYFIDRSDVINYVLSNIIDPQNIFEIFVMFEDSKTMMFYPGGLVNDPEKINSYQISSQKWYQTASKIPAENNNVYNLKNQFTTIDFIINPPEIDQLHNQKVFTITLPLVDPQNNNFIGVIGMQVLVSSFTKILYNNFVLNWNTSQLFILNVQNKQIYNDPLYVVPLEQNQMLKQKILNIDDYQYTQVDTVIWDAIIQNQNQQIIKIQDSKNVNQIVFLQNYQNSQNQANLLFVQVQTQDSFYQFKQIITLEIQHEIENNQFVILYLIIICFVTSLIIAAIYISIYLSPLFQLTETVKFMNNPEITKRIENKDKIDINMINGPGKIGELIKAFRDLLNKGLTGLRKKSSSIHDKNYELERLKKLYPDNLLKNQQMEWQQHIEVEKDNLKDFEIYDKSLSLDENLDNLLTNMKFIVNWDEKKTLIDKLKNKHENMNQQAKKLAFEEIVAFAQKEVLDKILENFIPKIENNKINRFI